MMESENTQTAGSESLQQDSEILGGGDVDVVIEELNDKVENAEDENITDEDDLERDEVVKDAKAELEKEVDIVEHGEDTGRDTFKKTVDQRSEVRQEEDEVTGNTDEATDDIEVLKDREIGIEFKSDKIELVEEERNGVPVEDKKEPVEIPEKKQITVAEENKENSGASEPNNNSIEKSISIFGTPVKKKEKGMFKVVQTEKCAACQKTVYAMEKLEMNGHIYHKNCFKCSHCSARLTAKTFSMNEGVIYCVNHFKQLFARKGNYDEGFGRQQYKKKWQGDKPEGATA